MDNTNCNKDLLLILGVILILWYVFSCNYEPMYIRPINTGPRGITFMTNLPLVKFIQIEMGHYQSRVAPTISINRLIVNKYELRNGQPFQYIDEPNPEVVISRLTAANYKTITTTGKIENNANLSSIFTENYKSIKITGYPRKPLVLLFELNEPVMLRYIDITGDNVINSRINLLGPNKETLAALVKTKIRIETINRVYVKPVQILDLVNSPRAKE